MSRPLLDIIMSRTSPEPNSGCWLWTGGVTDRGYAQITRNRRSELVHRVIYELTYGPIPLNLQIDHLCRVRCCVNPQHLEAVTAKENINRSKLVGKTGNKIGPKHNFNKTHCPSGHEYNSANTIMYNGYRYCRVCRDRRNHERTKNN